MVCDSREFHKGVVIKMMIRHSVIRNPVTPVDQEVHTKKLCLYAVKKCLFYSVDIWKYFLLHLEIFYVTFWKANTLVYSLNSLSESPFVLNCQRI